MEVTSLWPPWLSGSYHPRGALRDRAGHQPLRRGPAALPQRRDVPDGARPGSLRLGRTAALHGRASACIA
jgi:hypothetical protein